MNTYIKITIEKYSKRILLWKKLIRQGKSALKNRKFSILSIQKKDIYIKREREREREREKEQGVYSLCPHKWTCHQAPLCYVFWERE